MSRKKQRRVLRGAKLAAIISPPPIVYLFLDNFSVADAAPVADPLPADVIGSWDVTDTGNNVAVVGGVIDLTDKVTNFQDPRLWSATTFVAANGLALFVDVRKDGTGGKMAFGFADANSGDPVGLYLQYFSGGALINEDLAASAATGISITPHTAGVSQKLVIILRAAGAFIIVAETNNLLFIADAYNTATPFISLAGMNNAAADHDFNTVRLTQLPIAKIPSPIVSDDFGIIPTIADSGSNGLDGTPIRVGLSGSEASGDAANSFIDLDEVGLDANGFDGGLGTVIVEVKIPNDVAWQSLGGAEGIVRLAADASNEIRFGLAATDNQVVWFYVAGGTTKVVGKGSLTTNDWQTMGMSFSDASNDDRMQPYYDGVAKDAEVTGNGTWAGTLAATLTLVGAITTTPTQVLNGLYRNIIISLGVEATAAQHATINTALKAETLTTATLETIFGAGGYVWKKCDEQYISDGAGHLEADGNGSGIIQQGGTWSNASNKAFNAPLGGDEVIVNGDFTDWTADDPDGWTVTEVGDATSNITENPAGECQIISTGPLARILQVILTAGSFFTMSLDVKTVAAGSIVVIDAITSFVADYNSTGVKTFTFIALNVNIIIQQSTTPCDITIDDVSIQPLALADLLRLASTSYTDVIARDDLTITDEFQAGIGVRWDSQSSPANGIIVYFDRQTSEIVYVGKYVAGTYSEVSETSVTYSAGAKLEVRCIDNEVRVFYNNAFVVTVTISDAGIVSNILHGLFGTENASTHEKAQVWPVDAINYDKYFVGA